MNKNKSLLFMLLGLTLCSVPAFAGNGAKPNVKMPKVVTPTNVWVYKGPVDSAGHCPMGQSKIWNGQSWACYVQSQ